MDSTDPFGPSEGCTQEFYGICYNALRDDGIMVNRQGSPTFYCRDEGHAAQPQAHRQHFPHQPGRIRPISPTYAAGYWLFGFASRKYHPVDDFDRDKWLGLHLKTQYYTVRLHVGAFCLPAFLEEMLKEVEVRWIPISRPLSAATAALKARIVLFGAPFDSTTSFRPGARVQPLRHAP